MLRSKTEDSVHATREGERKSSVRKRYCNRSIYSDGKFFLFSFPPTSLSQEKSLDDKRNKKEYLESHKRPHPDTPFKSPNSSCASFKPLTTYHVLFKPPTFSLTCFKSPTSYRTLFKILTYSRTFFKPPTFSRTHFKLPTSFKTPTSSCTTFKPLTTNHLPRPFQTTDQLSRPFQNTNQFSYLFQIAIFSRHHFKPPASFCATFKWPSSFRTQN